MSSRELRANRSLANFAVLIIFSIAVSLFIISKANKVITELSEIESTIMAEPYLE